MDKLKILIVSKSFYPINSPRAIRTTEIAKEFARLGHEVTVLKPYGDFDLSTFTKEHRVNFKFFGPLDWATIQPSKKWWIGDLKRKWGRLLFLLLEYPNIEILWKLKPKLKEENEYDLMISIAVPHSIHWAIAQVRNKKRPIAKVWVADCGDPFMGNILESFRAPFYFAYFEKLFCSKADYISVPTENSKQAYYKEYLPKFRVIPQGFNFTEVKLSNEVINHRIPTFAYAGGIAPTGIRNLNKIIDYLIFTGHDFHFHIFSANAKSILNHYSKKHPTKINLYDPIERADLLFLLSQMDFLVNLDNGVTLSRPSKLIDYGLTGRPILNVSGVNPDTGLIDEFLARNYYNRLIIDNLQQYDIKNVTKQFLSLVKA